MSRNFDRQMKRLLNVAKAVAEGKGPFDMSEYTNAEGHPSCALGYYAARQDLQKTFTTAIFYYGDITNHFGLTEEEARSLFGTYGCGRAGRNRKKAVKFIKNFVAAKIKARKKK